MLEFFLGVIVGAWVSYAGLTALFRIMLKARGVTAEQWADSIDVDLDLDALEKEPTKVPVRVEQHGELFYLFDADTETFVAQGRDLKEINEHISQTHYRFTQVLLTDGDEEVINRLKATAVAA